VFSSETDSEVIAHLFYQALQEGLAPLDAFRQTIEKLNGAYGIVAMTTRQPDHLYIARHRIPVVVGHCAQDVFVGSDALALSGLAAEVIYLEDHDIAELSLGRVHILDSHGLPALRPPLANLTQETDLEKGPYAHFMIKEIHEQPDVVRSTLSQFLSASLESIDLLEVTDIAPTVDRITLVACGTSYYAAMVAKYWLETYARVPVDIDIASEFRYREAPLSPQGLAVFISQSGETADTIAALTYAKSQGQRCLSIVNVAHSSLDRLADITLYTQAGREIGVASTKAFMAQLVTLACLTLAFAQARKTLSPQEIQEACTALRHLPNDLEETLAQTALYDMWSLELAKASTILYIGRGTSYPLALEGALKLKEISYIHAEAFAAGEMKHGPIALIDHTVPLVVLAPHDALFEKTVSNMHEAAARQGQLLILTDLEGQRALGKTSHQTLALKKTHPLTMPMLYAVPMQLLAYYTAVHKGTDVDQPRNLAKSVTVE
jgi:glucosamine--fructose-6-phosphate aminotransferase (isomerizing)